LNFYLEIVSLPAADVSVFLKPRSSVGKKGPWKVQPRSLRRDFWIKKIQRFLLPPESWITNGRRREGGAKLFQVGFRVKFGPSSNPESKAQLFKKCKRKRA